ncbi:MAG TPA: sugar phosphate isomerase/epimerase [Pseudothermotoga sp.]|nr:sugar phosphate isomerase/epimerase [Pseudothermotoga sp.]HOK84416.1 sugar phosphate isomerase/epimerase [Pseudothermotoga sp.]HPP70602.1 sugar phosphate isomerase/epimerase [Pseudothermotoga sp.]
MKIGFHTDAFNSAVFSFEKALQWAKDHDVHYIECGVIDGSAWIHGLGYFPHISLLEDPMKMKHKMSEYGVRFSQLDSAYPLSGKDGMYIGVQYVCKTLPWAKVIGCENIATTDGLYKPEGLSDTEAMELMKRSYSYIVELAELYEININIEIHGYFTTKPEMLEKMLDFVKSDRLGLNLDTGNTFIAGQDPVEFCRKFVKKIKHVHIKDVSESLAMSLRGKDTGIGISHCAVGEGVNADNIRKVLEILRDNDYNGVLSIECEGKGGILLEKSLDWLRKTLKELDIKEEK